MSVECHLQDLLFGLQGQALQLLFTETSLNGVVTGLAPANQKPINVVV